MCRYVQEVAPDCLWVALSPTLRGRVHALDNAASLAELREFSAKFGAGQPLRCTIAQVRTRRRAKITACSTLSVGPYYAQVVWTGSWGIMGMLVEVIKVHDADRGKIALQVDRRKHTVDLLLDSGGKSGSSSSSRAPVKKGDLVLGQITNVSGAFLHARQAPLVTGHIYIRSVAQCVPSCSNVGWGFRNAAVTSL